MNIKNHRWTGTKMNSTLGSGLLLLVLLLDTAEARQKKLSPDQIALAAARGEDSALQRLRILAGQGDATAEFQLGRMYSEGSGVPKDTVLAENWYRKAAEQGEANAQSRLGAMYENGLGVPEDLVTAYVWYNLAAAKGNATLRNVRDQLEKRMTRKEVFYAQELSRAWKPK